jgi:hypothetical protein
VKRAYSPMAVRSMVTTWPPRAMVSQHSRLSRKLLAEPSALMAQAHYNNARQSSRASTCSASRSPTTASSSCSPTARWSCSVVSAGSKALPAGHAHSSMPPGSGSPGSLCRCQPQRPAGARPADRTRRRPGAQPRVVAIREGLPCHEPDRRHRPRPSPTPRHYQAGEEVIRPSGPRRGSPPCPGRRRRPAAVPPCSARRSARPQPARPLARLHRPLVQTRSVHSIRLTTPPPPLA